MVKTGTCIVNSPILNDLMFMNYNPAAYVSVHYDTKT